MQAQLADHEFTIAKLSVGDDLAASVRIRNRTGLGDGYDATSNFDQSDYMGSTFATFSPE